ncbi:DUF4419 domain-containing protein [Rhizophagus clarus]|uniref:DUF4419 domain-containing protein n=1 Tax=Rhizophagus clarus TaxID=94130 RepID=A0A8H3KYA4_9GLOM|nr:DUF4419 domain-containing protein [Rhizophagus clarus]
MHEKKFFNLVETIKVRFSNFHQISQICHDTTVHTVSIDYDDLSSNEQSVIKSTTVSHGLAAAIFHAYNKHQHLRLTPDDIWLTIAQGISQHINYNSEKFRYRFVKHEVLATDEAVEKFLQQPIILLPLVVYTVKAYFSYKMYFLCGIPKITLEGTLEDWVNLQEKVNKLRQLNLDMDFWLDKLDPVIWKLIETYKGEIDEEFWTKIISLNYFGSGGDFAINGWMTAFFPYRNDGKILENNSIEPNDIPNGRVEVPFTTDTGFSLKFVSGFLGTQQKTLENSNELVISPVICWLVIDNKDSEGENEN